MKPYQLFLIGIFIIVLAWGSLFITALNQDAQIRHIVSAHTSTISREAAQTQQIEQNQKTNSLAVKQYIACLIAINPQGNIQAQETACFNAVAQVK